MAEISSCSKDEKMALGWGIHLSFVKVMNDFSHCINENFVWIDEVVAEAKRTLKTDNVELLPKTPSSKRTRRKLNTSARVSSQGLCAERKSQRLSNRQRRENSLGSDANPSQRNSALSLEIIGEESAKEVEVKNADFNHTATNGDIENSRPDVSQLSLSSLDRTRTRRGSNSTSSVKLKGRRPNLESNEVENQSRRPNTRKRKQAANAEARTLEAVDGNVKKPEEVIGDESKRVKAVAVGRVTRSKAMQKSIMESKQKTSFEEPVEQNDTLQLVDQGSKSVSDSTSGSESKCEEILGDSSIKDGEPDALVSKSSDGSVAEKKMDVVEDGVFVENRNESHSDESETLATSQKVQPEVVPLLPLPSLSPSNLTEGSGLIVPAKASQKSGSSLPSVVEMVNKVSEVQDSDRTALVANELPVTSSSKAAPAGCSSFITWEPVSSVNEKSGIATHDSLNENKTSSFQNNVQTDSDENGLSMKPNWLAADHVAFPAATAADVSPNRIFLRAAKNLLSETGVLNAASGNTVLNSANSPVKVILRPGQIDDVDADKLSNSAVSQFSHVEITSCDQLNSDETGQEPTIEPGLTKIAKHESKLFPSPGSLKISENENHLSECGDNASPVKRFFSKMKVKIGSFMNSPLNKSPSDVANSPKSAFSGGNAMGLQKNHSVWCSERENGLLLEKSGCSSTAPMDGMENSSKEINEIGSALPNVLQEPSVETENMITSKSGFEPSENPKRLSKPRKSRNRRSSVRPRLSIANRRSSGFSVKAKTPANNSKSRISTRFMTALKRTLSRTPGKGNSAVQNEAELETGTSGCKKQIDVVTADSSIACIDEEQQPCYTKASSKFAEKGLDDDDDDDAVCDTPPVQVPRTKLQLSQASNYPTEQIDNAATDHTGIKPVSTADDYGTASSSSKPVCQELQILSSVKPKRHLGSRIKKLQDMICQTPSLAKKSCKRKSNTSIASNGSSVSSGPRHEPKKLGLWAAAQRRVSMKKAGKLQKTKGSRHVDLNDSRRSPAAVTNTSVVKTPVNPSPFPSILSKKPPSNLVTSLKSFVPSNTPVKVSREEQVEQKRKELEAKNKKLEEAEQRKQEQRLKKAEELKRQREEREQLVQKRRLERQQKEINQKREMMQKLEETAKASSLAMEERIREEKEKQKLREKRMADAEQRRKLEEESRMQVALQMERDRQAIEEQQRKNREADELCRQQKIAEQRRQEEDRRKQMEQERLAEQERLRIQEEQRQKELLERQRQKEERERKEKEERDKLEIERQRDRERQKEIEIEKMKEMERQRLMQKRAEEEQTVKEKNIQRHLEKYAHNLKNNVPTSSNTVASIYTSAVKSNPTNACTSATRVPGNANGSTVKVASGIYGCPASVSKPAAIPSTSKPAPSSLAVSTNSESYEMSPVKKIKKAATDENYDITDLKSDDSTDDESKPRKTIPSWAQGIPLKSLLLSQFTHPLDTEELFGPVYALDLNAVFRKKKPRFNKRTSSAAWDKPLLPNPYVAKF